MTINLNASTIPVILIGLLDLVIGLDQLSKGNYALALCYLSGVAGSVGAFMLVNNA